MKKGLAVILFLFSVTLSSQPKQALRVFSFDELSKKPLSCDHYYYSDNIKDIRLFRLTDQPGSLKRKKVHIF